jgi:hypothetical protein
MADKSKFAEESETEESEDKAEEYSWAERIYEDALRNIRSDILRSKLGK